MRYSENYTEDNSDQMDTGIAAWQFALKWAIYGRYFTASGHCYCSLNDVRYSENYMEDISQQVENSITAWMKCVTVNIVWKIIHSRWKLVLQLECSALEWTLYGRYFRAGGQWYCSLNDVRYTEHYMEGISQQVDTGIAARLKSVTVKIYGRHFTANGQWYCS